MNKLKSWNSYTTPNLGVVAALMGASHYFTYDNYEVEIQLPYETSEDQCRAVSWRIIDTVEVATEYIVNEVQVSIVLKDQNIDLPKESLSSNNIDHSYFSEEQKSKLASLLQLHSEVSKGAFLYWLNMMRWTCNDSTIGKSQPFSNESGWSTYLVSGDISKRVYSSVPTRQIILKSPVSVVQWYKVQQKVTNEMVFPMHVKFMFDAQESMRLNFAERAIVELALACENYLRYSVFSLLPDSLRQDFVEYIEEANINQYLNRFFKNSFDGAYLKNVKFNDLKSDISSLLSKRNQYMHMGKMDGANKENFVRYLKTTNHLFTLRIEDVIQSN
ncbi:hypothetical protein [Vibrio cholerae]|uniref:hypothetical protein n=1 Tax=Vibrio cholerae TaxID=666 RepID=UPI0030801BBA